MDAAGLGFEQIIAQGADATQLIVTALRYTLALHRGRIAPGGGVQQTKRGGFYSLPDAVIDEHLKKWSSARLAGLVEPLRAAQTRARAHAETAQMEASRSLLRIAQEARKR
jgi:DNA polymerase-3 subunit delta